MTAYIATVRKPVMHRATVLPARRSTARMMGCSAQAMRSVTRKLMPAFPPETLAQGEASVMRMKMCARLRVPMGCVTRVRTVFPALKIVRVAQAVEHVMPVSRASVMASAIQRKKPRPAPRKRPASGRCADPSCGH